MEQPLNKSIYLIGFMGCGKSTIAAALGKKLGVSVIEMDDLLEKRAQMPIVDLFAVYGEEHFRRMESDLVVELGTSEPCVVSCGGGVVKNAENVANMKRYGTVCWLTAAPETIYERVKNDTNRPLLVGRNSPEGIAAFLQERLPLYEAAAEVRVATDGRSVDDICADILRILR